MQKTREPRYPNGYLPKIQYWAEELYNACESGDEARVAKARVKIHYFCTRQYGD